MSPWDNITSITGWDTSQHLLETLPVRKQEALREQVAVAPAGMPDSGLHSFPVPQYWAKLIKLRSVVQSDLGQEKDLQREK